MDPTVAAKYNTMAKKWKENVAAKKINVSPRYRETMEQSRQKLLNEIATLPPPQDYTYSNIQQKASTIMPFAFPAAPFTLSTSTATAPVTKKKWNVKMPKYIRGGRKSRRSRKTNRKTRRNNRK